MPRMEKRSFLAAAAETVEQQKQQQPHFCRFRKQPFERKIRLEEVVNYDRFSVSIKSNLALLRRVVY